MSPAAGASASAGWKQGMQPLKSKILGIYSYGEIHLGYGTLLLTPLSFSKRVNFPPGSPIISVSRKLREFSDIQVPVPFVWLGWRNAVAECSPATAFQKPWMPCAPPSCTLYHDGQDTSASNQRLLIFGLRLEVRQLNQRVSSVLPNGVKDQFRGMLEPRRSKFLRTLAASAARVPFKM